MAAPINAQIRRLPHRARVAFAARCARLAEPLFAEYWKREDELNTVGNAIQLAESFAGGSRISEPRSVADEVSKAYSSAFSYTEAQIDHRMHFRTYEQSELGAIYSSYSSACNAAKFAVQAAESVARSTQCASEAYSELETVKHRSQLVPAAQRDLQLLVSEAHRLGWTDETPVPPTFFSLHSVFIEDEHSADSPLLEISTWIDEKLVYHFREHPEELYKLHPRRFEELVAELFSEFGYDVELTQRTRDGGSDIIAVRKSDISVKCLVECKRYARDRRVSVGTVRALHGVTLDQSATKGILATTSWLTRPADDYIQRHEWLLEARDYDGLLAWLNLYQQHKIAKLVGP